MLILSFAVNLLVLVPLLSAFAANPAGLDPVFGPDTDARRILVCLYATLALASVTGLVLWGLGAQDAARTLGLVLFSVQIAYKLMTVPAVGLASPVVLTNLAVVGVHAVTLYTLLARSG